MKKLFVIFLSVFLLFFSTQKIDASYDPREVQNNIFGAHIINHSDLEDLSSVTNVNGGDWGYVTIVISETDRNNTVWQKFMDDCRRLHLIPIVRVATKFDGQNWTIPKTEEIDNWINFFNSLNWVIENRYIVIGNEPNHTKEWGGQIKPEDYAIYLKTFSERLKNANKDYFVLNAGFDQDAPNSRNTMDQKKYMDLMVKKTPDVFSFIDGWNSHSYPNPAFSGSKTAVGKRSIRGYEWELDLINRNLPIFITETGWIRSKTNDQQQVAVNLKYAYEEIWMKDKNVVAVTPFVLNYTEEPFYNFSWKDKNGSYFPIYTTIQSIQKIKGEPIQKINGEIIFSFLNPLMLKNSERKGFSIVKNTGQAIWTQSESNVINETENKKTASYDVKISNTKFNPIEPFSTGLVVYTLTTPNKSSTYDVKLGFYVKGEKIGEVLNGKIISF